MSLGNLRKKIDTIDNELLNLLNKRTQEVIKVISLKKKSNLSVFSSEREASILKRLKKLNKGPLAYTDAELIFKEIFSVCRYLRSKIKVVYLGPQGTFTHLAAIKKFGKKVDYVDAESINEVFECVAKGEVDYGVVPIENSIEGVINYTLDMLFESDLKVCSEITLNIAHSLLTNHPKNNVRRIYSNPQVFAQCRRWLARKFPRAELIPIASTAQAARQSKKDRYGACIGNRILASLYDLKVVSSGIEDSSYNITRFLVIARHEGLPSGDDKTSVLFSIKDRVGALYDALSFFKRRGINLTKIESRPSKRKAWEYYFFVDFEGHSQDKNVCKVLKELQDVCSFIKILGSYPKEG